MSISVPGNRFSLSRPHYEIRFLRSYVKSYAFGQEVVLTQVDFKDQRDSHDRALVEILVKLALKFSYWISKSIVLGSFQRVEVMLYLGGKHYVGAIEAIADDLSQCVS